MTEDKNIDVKKSHGDYRDAIENFIVDDCPNGCYYNTIYDAFIDALDEDDIMDAIATLEDDGVIFYNENDEKYHVCADGVDKMKNLKKSDTKDYWGMDDPNDVSFINEVRQNGTVVGLEIERGHVFRKYEYNGQTYECVEHPDYPNGGVGGMYLVPPEPDYSVLTFDLFKKTIEDYLKAHSDEDFVLDEYTFHDEGNGHYTFSYDGLIYELMNYSDGSFKWGLHDALERAGFEWGVNVEQDTYSDIGYYNHSERKSARKMKKDTVRKEFTNPLVVNVNGREFSLNGTTHEGFDELQKYLEEIISSNKDEVRRYCDSNYESMGFTWYELMHEHINTDYDYIVYVIAHSFVNFIWDSCVYGGNLDWNDYFGITAEWVGGGDNKRKSVEKSYVPKYLGFKDMVGKMRNTRDNTKIFKE